MACPRCAAAARPMALGRPRRARRRCLRTHDHRPVGDPSDRRHRRRRHDGRRGRPARCPVSRHCGDRTTPGRGGCLARHRVGVADHQRTPRQHDPPRARPRPRVPPHPHARRADPASRRRHHLGVGVPRSGRHQSSRCSAARGRHDRRAVGAGLAPRPGYGGLRRHRRAGHPARSPPGGVGIVRRDGCPRSSLRRYRGATHRRRRPARQRRCRPCRLALRRRQRRRTRQCCATRAGISRDVVVRAGRRRRRLGVGTGARRRPGRSEHDHARHRLLAVPVRAA